MSGLAMVKHRTAEPPPWSLSDVSVESVLLTVPLATELLENNTSNRPVTDGHVRHITSQIEHDHWIFNGETIKIDTNGVMLDGQHRCWAVIESSIPVPTLIVRGLPPAAFKTIDTIRKSRSGADTLSVGHKDGLRYRNIIASALTWLLRWQRGALPDYQQPRFRIENADIEQADRDHPQMAAAVERCMGVRRLVTPSVIAFLYYVVSNQNPTLAERFIETLLDPTKAPLNDPIFRLRNYFTQDHHKKKQSAMVIALSIKALNAAAAGKTIASLAWKSQGERPEPFPKLSIS